MKTREERRAFARLALSQQYGPDYPTLPPQVVEVNDLLLSHAEELLTLQSGKNTNRDDVRQSIEYLEGLRNDLISRIKED